ncbi:MAG: hypothetical protein KF691_11840 [Phycisphaeraceae bacterium]|nr:hypothetical protein [Phycisphaeraceae bacterium]
MKLSHRASAAVVAGLVFAFSGSVLAQSTRVAQQSPQSLSAQRKALGLMLKTMSVDYQQTRLEAVMKNIADVTGAPLQILWQDDRNPVGLDKESLITFRADDMSALTVLEGVLSRAGADFTGGGNTWQMTESGMIEVGPKERLNRTKRLEIYDISDLLLEIPDYNQVPQFDLNSALQASSGGGGGGTSPFSGGGQQVQNTGKPVQERADEVIRLITELVEPDQWTNNGGSAATVRYYKQELLVTAPDYIQRQINGYPFWPAEQTQIEQDKKNRRVSFTPPRSSGVVQTANVPQPPSSTPAQTTSTPTTAETK